MQISYGFTIKTKNASRYYDLEFSAWAFISRFHLKYSVKLISTCITITERRKKEKRKSPALFDSNGYLKEILMKNLTYFVKFEIFSRV